MAICVVLASKGGKLLHKLDVPSGAVGVDCYLRKNVLTGVWKLEWAAHTVLSDSAVGQATFQEPE